jgi:hypothetical protein
MLKNLLKGAKKRLHYCHLLPPKVTDEYSTDPLLYFERDANNNLLTVVVRPPSAAYRRAG